MPWLRARVDRKAPTTARPEPLDHEPRRKRWPGRHKTLAALIGLIVLILLMVSALVVVARLLSDKLDHTQPLTPALAQDRGQSLLVGIGERPRPGASTDQVIVIPPSTASVWPVM